MTYTSSVVTIYLERRERVTYTFLHLSYLSDTSGSGCIHIKHLVINSHSQHSQELPIHTHFKIKLSKSLYK